MCNYLDVFHVEASVADPCHFGTDSDPDTRIRISD
jgi:hypothetical protein